MPIALNLTVPLKQDPRSQAGLKQLESAFATTIQQPIDRALAESNIVYFARVVVIKEKGVARYLQVLTEFDGDPVDYTEFFRLKLGKVFETIFALAEGAPPWKELNTKDRFTKYTHDLNLRSLGESKDGNDDRGYLFSAVGGSTVHDLRKASASAGAGHLAVAGKP